MKRHTVQASALVLGAFVLGVVVGWVAAPESNEGRTDGPDGGPTDAPNSQGSAP